MKKLFGLLTCMILFVAVTCENEPLEGDFVSENQLSCQTASVNTADAALAFSAATEDNYTQLCTAYKSALLAQIESCGDLNGSLQLTIDTLGNCNDATANNCDGATQAVMSAAAAFENATSDNYTSLCNVYKATLENQIVQCGDDDGSIQSIIDNLGDCSNSTQDNNLTLTLNGVEPLDAGLVYEAWLMVNGDAISIGRFNTTSSNFTTGFSVATDILQDATSLVLSLEESVNDDPAPSNTKLLRGDFIGTSADLTFGAVTGLEIDPDEEYMIFGNTITPTDGTTDIFGEDENYGFWFQSSISSGLNDLPELNSGWKYEGWVVFNQDTPLSTGQFTDAFGPDESSFYSGTFPGNP